MIPLKRIYEAPNKDEAELRASEKKPLLEKLAANGAKGHITLVFAASDTGRNSAVVLKRLVGRIPKKQAL